MSNRILVLQSAVVVTVAAVGGTVLYLALRKRLKRQYVRVGKVSKLLLYPVKSFAAQEVEMAELTKTGIKVGIINDRMWSVVDENGYHVDQKKIPRFVLLRAQFREGQMCIDGPGMETLKVDVLDKIPSGAKIVKCDVFKSSIDAVDCGEEAANWIQQFSGKPGLRLIQYVPELKPRPSKMRGLCKLKGENYPIFFQSGHTYLLLSEASIEDLNNRMEEKVTYLNFRPNILISGCQAFEEDKWKYVKIGETAVLVKTTPCDRCAITTINTETGEKTDKEPLISLRKYRQAKNEKERAVFKYTPLFGMNYGLDIEGKVSVGDDVYAVID